MKEIIRFLRAGTADNAITVVVPANEADYRYHQSLWPRRLKHLSYVNLCTNLIMGRAPHAALLANNIVAYNQRGEYVYYHRYDAASWKFGLVYEANGFFSHTGCLCSHYDFLRTMREEGLY